VDVNRWRGDNLPRQPLTESVNRLVKDIVSRRRGFTIQVLAKTEIRPASRRIWQGSRIVVVVLREEKRVRQTFPVVPCEAQECAAARSVNASGKV
jgi:hypothetical protein